MADNFRVRLVGHREVVKALRTVGVNLGPELKKQYKVIGYLLARMIRARSPSARLGATARPYATQRGFGVKVGSAAAPFVFPAEFGGTVPLFGGPRRVQYKPYSREGYFIFPTLRDARDDIQRAADTAVERAITRHF